MKQQGVIIQSVDRALQILECFNGSRTELGITEIATCMDLGKSTVYGLVNTLLTAGYLEQNNENKRYRLGLKLFELGSLVQNRMDIREIAKPFLKQLSEQFDLTVHMGLYRDGEVVYIDKMDTPNTRIIYSQVGKRAPMYCTGIGKAVFAFMSNEDISYLLKRQDRRALTNYTLIEEKKILDELEIVRNQGFAIDNEEVELGLRCIAVPVFDYKGQPIAAISMSGSVAVLSDMWIEENSFEIRKVALAISKALGYNGTNNISR